MLREISDGLTKGLVIAGLGSSQIAAAQEDPTDKVEISAIDVANSCKVSTTPREVRKITAAMELKVNDALDLTSPEITEIEYKRAEAALKDIKKAISPAKIASTRSKLKAMDKKTELSSEEAIGYAMEELKLIVAEIEAIESVTSKYYRNNGSGPSSLISFIPGQDEFPKITSADIRDAFSKAKEEGVDCPDDVIKVFLDDYSLQPYKESMLTPYLYTDAPEATVEEQSTDLDPVGQKLSASAKLLAALESAKSRFDFALSLAHQVEEEIKAKYDFSNFKPAK